MNETIAAIMPGEVGLGEFRMVVDAPHDRFHLLGEMPLNGYDLTDWFAGPKPHQMIRASEFPVHRKR